MKLWKILMLGVLVFCADGVFSEETVIGFRPAVFLNGDSDKGALVVSPREIVVLDSKGQILGRHTAEEDVSSAHVSPDGKKVAYTTSTGVWLYFLGSGERRLVAGGYCDALRWGKDSLSFMFAIYEKKSADSAAGYGIKFFWADGDGKNIKQVYP